MVNSDGGINNVAMTVMPGINIGEARGSNQRPPVVKSCTLQTELRGSTKKKTILFLYAWGKYKRSKSIFCGDWCFTRNSTLDLQNIKTNNLIYLDVLFAKIACHTKCNIQRKTKRHAIDLCSMKMRKRRNLFKKGQTA